MQLASVSVKNHANALRNPNAHTPMRVSIDEVLSPYFAALTRGDALATQRQACHRTWFAARLACARGFRDIAWRPRAGSGVVWPVTSGRNVLPGTAIAGTFVFA